jgi:2-methylcitrate dehydratase PrpD
MEFANAGTRDFPLHNAFAVKNGILAAYLAKHGATAPERIFEGKAGVGNAFSGTTSGLEEIGSVQKDALEIMAVYFKSYPACGFVQTTPKVALRVRNELKLKPEEIAEVTVGIFTMGKIWPGTDFSGPFEEYTQAQMSNQFVFAAALVDGQITPATLHNRKDPRYAEVAKKVKVEIDPDCDKNYPPKESVKLTVRTKDGREHTIYEEDLSYADDKFVVERFRSYGQGVLKESAIAALVERIENIEKVKNVAEITSLLVRTKR